MNCQDTTMKAPPPVDAGQALRLTQMERSGERSAGGPPIVDDRDQLRALAPAFQLELSNADIVGIFIYQPFIH